MLLLLVSSSSSRLHRDQCFAVIDAVFKNPFPLPHILPAQNLLTCRTPDAYLPLPSILISTSPFKHAPSNFLNVLFPFRKKRSGKVKDPPSSEPIAIPSFMPTPNLEGNLCQNLLLPSFPAHASPFFTARLIPMDGWIILEAPHVRSLPSSI